MDNSYESLGEKLLDYFELVEVYERKKLFILVEFKELFIRNRNGTVCEKCNSSSI